MYQEDDERIHSHMMSVDINSKVMNKIMSEKRANGEIGNEPIHERLHREKHSFFERQIQNVFEDASELHRRKGSSFRSNSRSEQGSIILYDDAKRRQQYYK